jgi:hypothetical protein
VVVVFVAKTAVVQAVISALPLCRATVARLLPVPRRIGSAQLMQ